MSLDATPAKDGRPVIIAVVLACFAALSVGGIWYWTRRRARLGRKDPEAARMHGRSGSIVLDKMHPAARITPFGASKDASTELPPFHHEPGANMRTAVRMENGTWEFFDVDPDPFAKGAQTPTHSVAHMRLSRSPFASSFDEARPSPYAQSFDLRRSQSPSPIPTPLLSPLPSAHVSSKEKEARKYHTVTDDGHSEWEVPPPAYGLESPTYTNPFAGTGR
ncbi:hypothetical protein BD626DRAFT_546681 [Schizophyllum amplum]|uniref:Uncharacterized protein n=1 Tax=Schizophyllum amplum TaxID=97359 RepID=A0A550CNN9_9AGAR|nr:hypothetical protein BD626DRAFT_546681 [Auriculariopsis ampla]